MSELSDVPNAYDHIRRYWAEEITLVELSKELGVNLVLANKHAKHYKPHHLPNKVELPMELVNIINKTDFRITTRGYTTKCWIWRKGKMIMKDPVTKRRLPVQEIVYRQCAGEDKPGSTLLIRKCRQTDCINYEHFDLISKAEAKVIQKISERKTLDLTDEQLKDIKIMGSRHRWTEKDMASIFSASIVDIV